MTLGRIVALVVVGSVAAVGGTARAGQQISPGCEKIVGVLDQSGDALSADEVAKRTGTDVETVRGCTDQWRATMKDKSGPSGAKAASPMPAGCEKIVGVLDQSGDALSADEVAKRTSTDVQTVRSCTDAWRRTMKRGANP
jgi:hypothetical protein